MGTWVNEEACRRNSQWQKDGMKVVAVSVNLSAYQLRSADIVDVVRKALTDCALSPRLISFELTESMVMYNHKRFIRILQEIKALGEVRPIYDFGTRDSSHSYLRHI